MNFRERVIKVRCNRNITFRHILTSAHFISVMIRKIIMIIKMKIIIIIMTMIIIISIIEYKFCNDLTFLEYDLYKNV